MKYRKILVFLIFSIIVLSCALITFAILSKDMENTSSNILLDQNIIAQNYDDKNAIDNELIENIIDENNLQNDNTVDKKNDEQTKSEKDAEKNDKQEVVSHSEEENNENQKSKQDKENIALELTKNEWGEDETVYYTIDRNVNDIYDISVRSKTTTQTLAEYKVDITNKTVEIK